MNTTAYVKEIKGKYAIVETERRSACDGCHKNENGEGCAMCRIFGGNTKISTKAKNSAGAKIGDKVEIASSSGRMLGYALIVFILPIVLAIAGYFIANGLGLNEGFSGLIALGAFLGCFSIIAVVSKLVLSKRCDVEIVKVIN